MHVYRWDLDKTYLQTEIESVRGLIRAALQSAREKRNVPGSAALLRSLVEHDPAARVFVLSGSPTQMRAVLEEKLRLDGIVPHDLVLKDNLGNLRRGRLRAVRDQLGYKLPRLLVARVGLGSAVRETLFGDDSEVDALVYAAYAALLRGELTSRELARLLEAGNVYPDAIEVALGAARQLGTADVVEDIFIHVDRGVPLARFALLGKGVTPVFSWFQAALVLQGRGRLSADQVVDVVRACTDDASLTEAHVAGLFQDTVRRGLAGEGTVRTLVEGHPELEPIRDPVLRALDRLGGVVDPIDPLSTPDFLGFLRA